VTDSARCVVCLRPASSHHPQVGDLCVQHEEALGAELATGKCADQIITRWRARIITAALHHLDEQGPPPDGQEEP